MTHATFHVFLVHFWWTEIFQLLPPITALFVFIASVARTPVLQSASSVRRDHGGTVGPEARTMWSAVADTTFQFDRLNLVISGYSKIPHFENHYLFFEKMDRLMVDSLRREGTPSQVKHKRIISDNIFGILR